MNFNPVIVQVLGADKAALAMRNLKDSVQKAVVRAAVRAGGKLLLKETKALAPKKSGALRRGLRNKYATKKDFIGAWVVSPTREQLGAPAGYKYYYPAHVELGHKIGSQLQFARKNHGLIRRALGRGSVKPVPYMRNAVRSKRSKIMGKVREVMLAKLMAAVRAARAGQ